MSELDYEFMQAMESHRDNQNLPRWQLDLSAELYKFKLALLGLVPNENYGQPDAEGTADMREFIPAVGANLVNYRGAIAIHNKLQSELTKIPSDTNYDKKIIATELMAFESDFSFWLAVNSEEFDLSDKDYNTVCEIAIRLIKGALYRSIGGWKGKLINNNTQQVIRETQNNEVVERNRAPKIFGFMGR